MMKNFLLVSAFLNLVFSYNRSSAVAALMVGLALMAAPSSASAQGQDGLPAERHLQILAEMLPGRYDNANQAYFDRRLKKPETAQHERSHISIRRVDAGSFGDNTFLATLSVGEGADTSGLIFSLDVDRTIEAVRMRIFRLDTIPEKRFRRKGSVYLEGCDIIWREEAGQFRGRIETSDACVNDGETGLFEELLLSEDALWTNILSDGRGPVILERARQFSCYVDVPGVGGGRDIPFKRYRIEDMHDKGGKAWITLEDGSEVSVTLQNIKWPMNNEKDIFTRHSFVMYIGKKEDDESKEVGYTWTVPDAQRIGINLKWMLANCYMISNEDVTPYFKQEPKL